MNKKISLPYQAKLYTIYSGVYDIFSTIYYRLTEAVCCANIHQDMNFLSRFLKLKRRELEKKTLADHNREALVKNGHDQFKKLVDKGLSIPVALL